MNVAVISLSGEFMSYFNPLRWTALTWLAVFVWSWGAFPLNFPPSVSYELDSAGNYVNADHYSKLSEYPFPVGWPFHYVEPDDPMKRMAPVVVGAPLPIPGPSNVSFLAMFANALLILAAISALIVLLQAFIPKFSLRLFLALPLLYPVHFAGARLTGIIVGNDFISWYTNGIYFLPVFIYVSISMFGFPIGFPDKLRELNAEIAR